MNNMFYFKAFFLSAWTPYAILAMWSSFGDASNIPPVLFTVLSSIAKTSYMLNPILYIGTNRRYRSVLHKNSAIFNTNFCVKIPK